MTLTLDEVRKVQFHESRRRGYEVTDVDLFVDRVEASFEQLIEENDALKQEVEALKKASGNAATAAKPSNGATQGEDSPLNVTDDTAEQPAVRVGDSSKPRETQQSSDSEQSSQGSVSEQSRAEPTIENPTIEKIVVSTSAEASPAVIRLVQMATEQAETLVSEADAQAIRTRESADTDAQFVLDDANRQARTIGADASTRAEQIESEARVNADRVRGEAQSHADNLNTDIEKRRVDLFTDLDRERDELVSAVAQLRQFEQTYRGNLTDHLQGQLSAVRDGRSEPDQVPALANSNQTQAASSDAQDSSTPRLDALLGDRDDA